MRHLIQQALGSSLLREVAITYSGQVVGSGLGFVIQLLLQKQLGPADYGILSIAVSVGVFAAVLTDVGISHAMIRFGSKWLGEAPGTSKAMARCAAALRMRVGLAAVVSVVGYLSSGWILSTFYPHAEGLGTPLRLVFVTLFAHTLFGYWMFFIQTFQKFALRSMVTIGGATLRLSAYLGLAATGQVSAAAVILLDASVNFVTFLVAMQFSPRGILHPPREELSAAYREILPYLRYTGIMIVADTMFSELDILMLGVLSTEATTGLYRAAWTYAMVLSFLSMSVGNVLFPKITGFSDIQAMKAFVKKAIMMTSLLAVGTLWSLPVVTWWVPWYEPQYSGAVSIFYIMYLGTAFDLVVGPLGYTLYSLNRPDILVKIAIGKILLHAAGNWFLIPMYGAHGAAAAATITRVLGGLVAVTIMLRTIRRSSA
ncbi:MAG: oligosaccharide flippase family protein [Vicinamibacterales bacterium]